MCQGAKIDGSLGGGRSQAVEIILLQAGILLSPAHAVLLHNFASASAKSLNSSMQIIKPTLRCLLS